MFLCSRVSKHIGTEDGLLSDPQTGDAQALLRDLRQADLQRLPAAGAQRTQVRHPCTSSLKYFPAVLFSSTFPVLTYYFQGSNISQRLKILCKNVTLAVAELYYLPPNTELSQSCFTHMVMRSFNLVMYMALFSLELYL